MRYDATDDLDPHKDVSAIAHNLRVYANAGTKPDFAAKLLAAASELDVLAGERQNRSKS